jgi:TonB family protein
MNNFKKYGLLLAIIISIFFHFIVIKNFSFKKFQSNNLEASSDIEITIIKPSNITSSKKNQILINDQESVSKKLLVTSDKKINNKNYSNSKSPKIENSEASKESNSKLIDTSKILSELSDIGFSTKIDKRKRQQRVISISANTSDYLYRLYFEAWKQKVEQIGTMNYPREASKLGMFGSLRLTVSLNADGMIENLFINKSSGYKELDEAALNIVKLGAPYAKFPAEIQKKVDIINITRKWKFTERNNFSR